MSDPIALDDARARRRSEQEAPPPQGEDDYGVIAAAPERPPPDRQDLLLASWLKRDLPLRDHLLGNVLCTTSRWLLFGETGVGKTLFGLDMSAAVAAGTSFLNWAASNKPRRVIYLDGELPAETFKERMELIASRYGSDLQLFGYNRDALTDNDLPPLNTPAGEKWLWREIDHVRPDLITFDSIMCLLAGSMSEEESWVPVKALVRKISSRRIAQIWLHHTGHDTAKGFGTKTREWEMDTVLSLTKGGEDDESLSMEFKKARLRTPETREQFAARKITCGSDGWMLLVGQVPKPGDGRSRDVLIVRRAIVEAYNRLCDGIVPSPGFDGKPVRKVRVDAIRDDVKSRGLLEINESGGLTNSGRSTFHRAKADIIAAKTHIESDGCFWKLSPNA